MADGCTAAGERIPAHYWKTGLRDRHPAYLAALPAALLLAGAFPILATAREPDPARLEAPDDGMTSPKAAPPPLRFAQANADPPNTPHRFDIAPQDLNAALLTFADRTGIQVFYDVARLKGRRTAGVRGTYTVAQALGQLLAGTQLTYRFTSATSVTLEPVPADQTAPPDGTSDRFQIDPTTVEAAAALPPSADPVQGYKADVATTATRSALPITETPASIGVVTADYIRDTFSRTQNDALEQVSGVSRSNTRLGRGEGINIRGFQVNSFAGSFSGLKANGLPTDGVFAPDPALIERYEVLKGPASIVGGAANPGGVVNRITKRPLGENVATAGFQTGSFSLYRGVADINGVLLHNKNLRGRLIMAYEDGGKFIDDVEESQYTIAPSLETDLFGGAGTLLLTGHYQYFDGSSYPGFPLLANGEVPDIPRTRNFGGGSDAGAETRFSGYNGELHYDHEFVSNLKLSAKGKYSRSDLSDKIVYAYAFGGLPESGDVNMSASLRENEFETYAGEIFLSKEFEAFGQRHGLLAGIDHRDQTQDFFNAYQYVGYDNIFDPANDFKAPADAVLEAAANQPFRVQLKQTGVFGQAIARPIERLTLVAAGRFDWADSSFKDKRTGDRNDESPSEFTGRAGAVYALFPWMNVYAGYAESFEPPVFATTADGSLLPPESGQQYEVGAKFDFLDGRFGITTALYRAYRQNVATQDPDNPRFSIATGEQRHQGFELDMNGQPWPGLNLTTNFSFVDAEITKSNDGFEGETPTRIPKDYTGRVFLTYELQSGLLKGFGFGGGVYFQSDFELSLPNNIKTDGYERVDAVLFYRYRDKLGFSLNVRNLLDKTYIENPGGLNAYNNFGAPTTVLLQIRYKF